MVALDPAADVDEQREAGGVAFRKAVFAEALDLLEDALGVLARVALLDHPPDQPLVERRQAAAPLPRRHRAAQLIGLAGGEVGGEHGDLHHLLLEDRHAQGAHQRRLELRRDSRSRSSASVRFFRYGWTMPPWIGPGRTIATSTTRS